MKLKLLLTLVTVLIATTAGIAWAADQAEIDPASVASAMVDVTEDAAAPAVEANAMTSAELLESMTEAQKNEVATCCIGDCFDAWSECMADCGTTECRQDCRDDRRDCIQNFC